MSKVYWVVFCTLLISLFGCSKVNEVSKDFKSENYVSTTIKFNDESFNENEQAFFVDGNDFSPKLTLINDYPTENEYRLFVFVDYKLTKVKFNNEASDFLDLKLSENSLKEINITIQDLSKGMHDIVVLSVRNPNDYLDQETVVPPEEYFLAHRSMVFVNNQRQKPSIKMDLIETSNEKLKLPLILSTKKENAFDNSASLINHSIVPKIWSHIKVDVPETEYAVIGLLDTTQIPFDNPFIKSNTQGAISFPIYTENLKVNKNRERKNLILLAIPNPYKVYEVGKPWRPLMANKVTIY